MRFALVYGLAKADFLERVRRYSFLLTLLLTVYFGYLCAPPNHARYITLQLAGHRPLYNSAYLGTLLAMQTGIFLSLTGFFLVKNAVSRDERTGVGQILAATRMTKFQYLAGKQLSNFAVLAAMTALVAVAAGVMQLVRAEDIAIHVWALLSPFLIITLPAMAMVASLALLFEVVPFLRGGLGNTIYFFLWIAGLAAFGSATESAHLALDPSALGAVGPSIRAACGAALPACAGTSEFAIGFNFSSEGAWNLATFRWEGVAWSAADLLSRLFWVGLSLMVVLGAAARFRRFDPSRGGGGKAEKPRRRKAVPLPEAEARTPVATGFQVLPRNLAVAARGFRFGSLVAAELRLALQGVNRWWYVVAVGMFVAGVVTPPAVSRVLLIAAWIWPIVIWSAMGAREARQGTGQLVFSAAHPLLRQLPAAWVAGVLITVLAGGGTGLRFLLAGDTASVFAWVAGALFIPTLALALGVWSGSGKLFEVIYLLLWYAGPANQIAAIDFTGSARAGATAMTPLVYLAVAASLGGLALLGRWKQVTGQ